MPRFFHWVYAHLAGYFWEKCRLCGKGFGGHEESCSLYLGHGLSGSVCINCKTQANIINKENWQKERLEIEEQMREH